MHKEGERERKIIIYGASRPPCVYVRALRIYRFYQFAILQFMLARISHISTPAIQVIKICMCKVGLKR